MSRVPFDPMPGDLMSLYLQIQLLPEIYIFHRFLVSRQPAPPFPVLDPLGDALPYVLTVRGQADGTAFL